MSKFVCPNCNARLIVPTLPDGTFSPDQWWCPNCHKIWLADDIDEYRKSKREERQRKDMGQRPKRGPSLL